MMLIPRPPYHYSLLNDVPEPIKYQIRCLQNDLH